MNTNDLPRPACSMCGEKLTDGEWKYNNEVRKRFTNKYQCKQCSDKEIEERRKKFNN